MHYSTCRNNDVCKYIHELHSTRVSQETIKHIIHKLTCCWISNYFIERWNLIATALENGDNKTKLVSGTKYSIAGLQKEGDIQCDQAIVRSVIWWKQEQAERLLETRRS